MIIYFIVERKLVGGTRQLLCNQYWNMVSV